MTKSGGAPGELLPAKWGTVRLVLIEGGSEYDIHMFDCFDLRPVPLAVLFCTYPCTGHVCGGLAEWLNGCCVEVSSRHLIIIIIILTRSYVRGSVFGSGWFKTNIKT